MLDSNQFVPKYFPICNLPDEESFEKCDSSESDHKLLNYLHESPMQNKKIQMWTLSLSGYNCSIEYIEGTTNTCADLLSRHPDKVSETLNSD